MKLKRKITKEIIVLGSVFILMVFIASTLFINLNSSLYRVINEAEPTADAIDHMIQDVYRDNIILLEYLNTEDYGDVTLLDERMELSNHRCSQVENNMENLIITETISDPRVIEGYETAYVLHENVETIKDELIKVHKEELAIGEDLSFEKSKLLEEHSMSMDKAIETFVVESERIGSRNAELKSEILWRSKIYSWTVVLLFFSFICITTLKLRRLGTKIIDPIDETTASTRKFIDGDYNSRIFPSKEVSEINELQSDINQVFSVIKKLSNEDKENRKQIESQLLKQEYIDILNFIKQNELYKRKTNISDLKRHFGVTHPTMLERLKYLEERNFIKFKKEGREKFLILTGKF